jgi:hypothetical protein
MEFLNNLRAVKGNYTNISKLSTTGAHIVVSNILRYSHIHKIVISTTIKYLIKGMCISDTRNFCFICTSKNPFAEP